MLKFLAANGVYFLLLEISLGLLSVKGFFITEPERGEKKKKGKKTGSCQYRLSFIMLLFQTVLCFHPSFLELNNIFCRLAKCVDLLSEKL